VRAAVAEPSYDASRNRVTGVLLDATDDTTATEADLVVDATGRGTRLPVWLDKWGFERPREETVDVGIAYATQQVHVPEGLIAEKVVVAGASNDQPVGLGMLFYEDGNWGVTTFGVGKVEPPQNFAEICTVADKILPAHVAAGLRQGEPLGEMAFHKYPTSRWRRYDKLTRFPGGIIPFGDAVASFNPTYGQGMTMTSLQAGHLRRALEAPDTELWRDLSRATAKTTFPVWQMNAIGDFTLHRASGPMPKWYGPVGNLFDQFLGAETEFRQGIRPERLDEYVRAADQLAQPGGRHRCSDPRTPSACPSRCRPRAVRRSAGARPRRAARWRRARRGSALPPGRRSRASAPAREARWPHGAQS